MIGSVANDVMQERSAPFSHVSDSGGSTQSEVDPLIAALT